MRTHFALQILILLIADELWIIITPTLQKTMMEFKDGKLMS